MKTKSQLNSSLSLPLCLSFLSVWKLLQVPLVVVCLCGKIINKLRKLTYICMCTLLPPPTTLISILI